MEALKPIVTTVVQLRRTTSGIPPRVYVTGWGKPLAEAKHVIFYFGGMPASAVEPALHSLAAGQDVYRTRDIHLLCMDKPGMGQTPLAYRFRLQRDWPEMVHQVRDYFGIEEYHVMGVSNGGPYVMACLTHETTAPEIRGAAMIVGVSNVRARYVPQHAMAPSFSFGFWSGSLATTFHPGTHRGCSKVSSTRYLSSSRGL